MPRLPERQTRPPGAGQWGAPRVQQEYRKGKAARKKAKQENRWR